jgi:hypothetical protein
LNAGYKNAYEQLLMDNGINTFEFPMRHLPGSMRLAPADRFVFDLMHLIPDGAGKSYGAVIVWCLVHYKYATIAELQAAQSKYAWPRIAGGKLPNLPDSLQTGTIEDYVDADGVTRQRHMPTPGVKMNHMSAGQTLVWMQHSVELFRPFIERSEGEPPKWWSAWELYNQIMHTLMARCVNHKWAQRACCLIQKFHKLVLEIPELRPQFRKAPALTSPHHNCAHPHPHHSCASTPPRPEP